MKRIRVTCLMMVMIMVLSTGNVKVVGEVESDYLDLNEASPWAIESIEKSKRAGYLPLSLSNNFKDNITREEFSELVVKVYEYLAGESIMLEIENPYSDTGNEEVIKASQLGIVNGVGNSKFEPSSNITREQMATMFYRMLSLPEFNLANFRSELDYDDNEKIAGYALEASEFLNHYNIIGGIGDNQYAPNNTASKQQAIVIATRICDCFDGFLVKGEYPECFALGDKGDLVLEYSSKIVNYINRTNLDDIIDVTDKVLNRDEDIQATSVYNEKVERMIDYLKPDYDGDIMKLLDRPELAMGENVPVVFKDKIFESHIRERIGKEEGEIFSHDLIGIRYLNSDFSDLDQVVDISGIEKMTNLRTVILIGLEMEDFSKIGELKQLESLNLRSSQIKDIGFVSKLPYLKELSIQDTDVSSIEPVSHLCNLEILFMSESEVTSLSPLTNLKNLNSLSIREIPVIDISPIYNLEQLEIFMATFETVEEFMKELPRLVDLYKKNEETIFVFSIRIEENNEFYINSDLVELLEEG